MNDATILGTVPTGSIVIRKATAADRRIDPSRVLLIEEPGGQQRWLTDPAGMALKREIAASCALSKIITG